MDPPPAIMLETEEAAAAREETKPAAPATVEQAKSEGLPRPINPFLQRLAQPAADTAAGPTTSSAPPPSSEEPAELPTSANSPPSSAADPATKRRSGAEAWPEVRNELRASRTEFIRARSRMQAAGETLDDSPGARGGIPTKDRRREGGPSRLPRRTRPPSGPTRVDSCSGAGEGATCWIPANNRFAQCGAAKAARGGGGEPLADPKRCLRRSGRPSTAT